MHNTRQSNQNIYETLIDHLHIGHTGTVTITSEMKRYLKWSYTKINTDVFGALSYVQGKMDTI